MLPPLDFSSVRYFIMKSSNLRNIDISQQKGIWSTIPGNETKLTKALQENEVILIFSVQGSGHFQVGRILAFKVRILSLSCLRDQFNILSAVYRTSLWHTTQAGIDKSESVANRDCAFETVFPALYNCIPVRDAMHSQLSV